MKTFETLYYEQDLDKYRFVVVKIKTKEKIGDKKRIKPPRKRKKIEANKR